jgi:hypothetical protein
MEQKNMLQYVLLWADRLGRWLISLIFLVAAFPKLFNVHEFAATIDAYGLLPDILLLPMAVALPVLEILLALGLLFNRLQSKIGIAVMLLFFISLLSYSIWQGLDIDCGCFGPEDPEYLAFKGLRLALVRDIVMLFPLVYSFWYHRYRRYTFQIEGDQYL